MKKLMIILFVMSTMIVSAQMIVVANANNAAVKDFMSIIMSKVDAKATIVDPASFKPTAGKNVVFLTTTAADKKTYAAMQGQKKVGKGVMISLLLTKKAFEDDWTNGDASTAATGEDAPPHDSQYLPSQKDAMTKEGTKVVTYLKNSFK